MLPGTKCTKVTKKAVRNHIKDIFDRLFYAQVSLAKEDDRSNQAAKAHGRNYRSLCYWDARHLFDPLVQYVASVLVDLTTGWFWPSGYDDAGDGIVLCGFAGFYHEEIMEKISSMCNDIKDYYDGTQLATTWSYYDEGIRKSLKAYKDLLSQSETYVYGVEDRKAETGSNGSPAL